MGVFWGDTAFCHDLNTLWTWHGNGCGRFLSPLRNTPLKAMEQGRTAFIPFGVDVCGHPFLTTDRGAYDYCSRGGANPSHHDHGLRGRNRLKATEDPTGEESHRSQRNAVFRERSHDSKAFSRRNMRMHTSYGPSVIPAGKSGAPPRSCLGG